MSAPGLDPAAKARVDADVRAAAAGYIGQTLDQIQMDEVRDTTVDVLNALQGDGTLPLYPPWSVSVSPDGVITIKWMNGFDEFVIQ